MWNHLNRNFQPIFTLTLIVKSTAVDKFTLLLTHIP